MKTLKNLLILFISIAFFSCTKDDPASGRDVIISIQTAVQPENALRVDITLQLKKKSSCRINYWKKGNELSKKQTSASEAALSPVITLVFLEPETTYCFQVEAMFDQESVISDEYEFTTDALPVEVPVCSMISDNMKEDVDGYILLMQPENPGYVEVVNPEGVVVWYEKMNENVLVATFDTNTNTFSCITGNHPDKAYTGKMLVVMDIYGNKLLRKNVENMYVHHDIRRLPDGRLIVIHYVPKTFDLSKYGGAINEKVWGDGYFILDMEGNVLESWDCFGELNPQDDPNIMKTVAITEVLDKPIKYREDWLHANSINFDSEGNFYMSFNWRSELWKIDAKTGKVSYRVGKNGNVNLPTEGIASGMHSVFPVSPNKILVYDNGLTNHISRALLYNIDEVSGNVTIDLNVPLDVAYTSPYMSSVRFINDNLLLFGGTLSKCIVFTTRKGEVLRTLSTMFQSFRADYIPEINY
jgi:hypothetical protein bacD2_13663